MSKTSQMTGLRIEPLEGRVVPTGLYNQSGFLDPFGQLNGPNIGYPPAAAIPFGGIAQQIAGGQWAVRGTPPAPLPVVYAPMFGPRYAPASPPPSGQPVLYNYGPEMDRAMRNAALAPVQQLVWAMLYQLSAQSAKQGHVSGGSLYGSGYNNAVMGYDYQAHRAPGTPGGPV